MNTPGACTVFGHFRLYPAERRLLKDDAPVSIGARELDILIALVEQPGKVVSKRELFARVWPGVVVEESSLRVQVAGLSRTLGEARDEARYIANVAGRGYSFVGPLITASPSDSRSGTEIIGRDRDLATVTALLGDNGLVTLHGAGGIGKTTLARAVADELSREFRDGCCFVDLSLNSGAHTAAHALASALQLVVDDPSSQNLLFLRGREMLLVFDSCETCIASAASLAEDIALHAPGVAILATSREPLRARGEHIYPLEPLDSPPLGAAASISDLSAFPAARLFCERARAGGFRNEFQDADAAIIGEICRRVDGNALALELAASRVSTYGLRQTADLLDSHMKLTWRGRRTAPPRHQTLNAMLDWSFALIDERERNLLRRLSVFAGGFGLDELRAVAGEGDADIEAMEQLVVKSLVVADTRGPRPRFRLLDTTRTYASAKLIESGMAAEIRRRHARYYLDWLTRSADVAVAPVEHTANLRAALEWAFSPEGDVDIGLGLATHACELLLRLGMLSESRRWSERALASLPRERAGSLQEVALQAALGHAAMISSGDADSAREALGRALRITEQLGDPVQQFRLLNSMHYYHRRIGSVDELFPISEHAAKIAARMGGAAPVVAARGMLGLAHHLRGDLAAAHDCLVFVRDARLGAGATNNFYGYHRAAEALIARTRWLQGFPDEALRIDRDANSADAYQDPITACLVLTWSVNVHYLRGDWATTEICVGRLLAIASEHGYLPFKWYALAIRGELQCRRGDLAAGQGNLQENLWRLREGRYDIYTSWLTCCLAESLCASGQPAQARKVLDDFDPDPVPKPDVYMPEFLRIRGVVAARAGDVAAAQKAFQASLELADRQGALSWRLRTVVSRARLQLAQGEMREARQSLAETCARFTEGFDTRDLVEASALLAEIDSRGAASAAG